MANPAPKTFAIDFDKTWTADPAGFSLIVHILFSRGHKILIATNRDAWCDDMERHNLPGYIPIIYCGRTLKEQACLKAGHKVDIWIDDMPGTIQDCRILGDQPL